jgi:hypothetical protein
MIESPQRPCEKLFERVIEHLREQDCKNNKAPTFIALRGVAEATPGDETEEPPRVGPRQQTVPEKDAPLAFAGLLGDARL